MTLNRLGKTLTVKLDEPVRPVFTTDEILEYLDELRESGETNMYGAAPYVKTEFEMNVRDARTAVAYWMKTFSQRHPEETETE